MMLEMKRKCPKKKKKKKKVMFESDLSYNVNPVKIIAG